MDSGLNITDSVVSSLKCPMCAAPFTIPVYQCANGHSFCRLCTETYPTCSECNIPFTSKFRNLTLEKILEGIQVDCQFKGCRQAVSLAHRQIHENACDFNPEIGCIVTECLWTGANLREHLKTSHDVKEFVMPSSGAVRGWNSKSWKNADWGYSIWQFDDEIILNKSYSDRDTFYVYVYHVTGRRRVLMRTLHSDYGVEVVVPTLSIRGINKREESFPFHISITEAEAFLLEPADGFEEEYKRLSLFVSLVKC